MSDQGVPIRLRCASWHQGSESSLVDKEDSQTCSLQTPLIALAQNSRKRITVKAMIILKHFYFWLPLANSCSGMLRQFICFQWYRRMITHQTSDYVRRLSFETDFRFVKTANKQKF